ncbi:hypothetical protein bcgnr5377_65600 [Bacillus cereus]
MSVFKRLRDLTMSNVYSLIEKAEDPGCLLEQPYELALHVFSQVLLALQIRF